MTRCQRSSGRTTNDSRTAREVVRDLVITKTARVGCAVAPLRALRFTFSSLKRHMFSSYLTSAFLSGHGFGERCGSVASGPPVLLSTSCSQVLALGWCAPCHTHVLPCHRCAALIGRTQGWCSCCHSCARRGFCRPWRLSWHTCISRHPTQVGRPIVNARDLTSHRHKR